MATWGNNNNRNNGYYNNGGYNNNRNNGYNNNRSNDRGYNNSRNNNWGNDYDDRDRFQDQRPRPFEINQAVRHIATGVRLIVISYGREQIECRKPDLSADYFYEYELEPMPEGQQ